MKRAAAIIGPTPRFVRWAIKRPCVLREINDTNLPGSTFRQLRSLTELSLAISEKRIFDGVVFKADTDALNDERVLGFLAEEVLEAHGGRKEVEQACGSCDANILENGWAGCHGTMILGDETLQALLTSTESTVEQFGEAVEFELLTTPAWYTLWTESVMAKSKMKVAFQAYAVATDDCALKDNGAIKSFCKAVELCLAHELELHVEHFPTGHSDGVEWCLDLHCHVCKAACEEKVCPVCGQKQMEQSKKRRKVMGLRPYMDLRFIFGEQEARKRYADFLEARNATELSHE